MFFEEKNMPESDATLKNTEDRKEGESSPHASIEMARKRPNAGLEGVGSSEGLPSWINEIVNTDQYVVYMRRVGEQEAKKYLNDGYSPGFATMDTLFTASSGDRKKTYDQFQRIHKAAGAAVFLRVPKKYDDILRSNRAGEGVRGPSFMESSQPSTEMAQVLSDQGFENDEGRLVFPKEWFYGYAMQDNPSRGVIRNPNYNVSIIDAAQVTGRGKETIRVQAPSKADTSTGLYNATQDLKQTGATRPEESENMPQMTNPEAARTNISGVESVEEDTLIDRGYVSEIIETIGGEDGVLKRLELKRNSEAFLPGQEVLWNLLNQMYSSLLEYENVEIDPSQREKVKALTDSLDYIVGWLQYSVQRPEIRLPATQDEALEKVRSEVAPNFALESHPLLDGTAPIAKTEGDPPGTRPEDLRGADNQKLAQDMQSLARYLDHDGWRHSYEPMKRPDPADSALIEDAKQVIENALLGAQVGADGAVTIDGVPAPLRGYFYEGKSGLDGVREMLARAKEFLEEQTDSQSKKSEDSENSEDDVNYSFFVKHMAEVLSLLSGAPNEAFGKRTVAEAERRLWDRVVDAYRDKEIRLFSYFNSSDRANWTDIEKHPALRDWLKEYLMRTPDGLLEADIQNLNPEDLITDTVFQEVFQKEHPELAQYV